MEYWNYQNIDERIRSDCDEMPVLEHIDEHLTLERNKNHYLMRKNESLLNANQQFATSYESLKLQMNSLLQERTALFQKNVSLLHQQCQLKRELTSYKEVLYKTSSKNKTLLLSIKSTHEELMTNIKQLDDFIASIPPDNDECQIRGHYEEQDEKNPRFVYSSPPWDRIYPSNTVLTPIQEERLSQITESCSIKKSRLGRNAFPRNDVTSDKNANDIICRNPPKEDCASSRCSESPFKFVELQINNASLNEEKQFTTKSKDLSCYISGNCVSNQRKDRNCTDKTFLILDSSKENNKAFGQSTRKRTNEKPTDSRESAASSSQTFLDIKRSLIQKQTYPDQRIYPDQQSYPDQKTYSDQQSVSPQRTPFQREKCFFSPLQEKKDNDMVLNQFDKLPSATPIVKNKSYFKHFNTPSRNKDHPKLLSLQQCLDSKFNVEGSTTDKMTRNEIDTEEQLCLKTPLSQRKPIKESSSKRKRRLSESKMKCRGSEGRRKKRKSVFEVVDEKDYGEGSVKTLVTPNKIINFDNRSNNTKIESDAKRTSEKKKPNTRSREIKTTDVKTKTSSTSKNKKKVDDDPPVILKGVTTRSRSKAKNREVDKENETSIEKINGRKCEVRLKNKKVKTPSDKGNPRNVRNKRDNNVGPKLDGIKTPVKDLDRNNRNSSGVNLISIQNDYNECEKNLPISTPKSFLDTCEPMDLNKISISPISKIMHNPEQNINMILNPRQMKSKDEYPTNSTTDKTVDVQTNQEMTNQKKYVVLADLLKSNCKYATQSDIDQIKKFLGNIGCGDKIVTRNSVDQQNRSVNIEMSPKADSGISNNSIRDQVTSLLSTLSPSLASIIKSLEIQDESNVEI